MSTASVLHNGVREQDERRLATYKTFAAAFAYPDEKLFDAFGIEDAERAGVQSEYDHLFRAGGLWLEGAEHMVRNEFQRANLLADIMGFYRAFGVEPDRERPDALTCQLEFMHVLIAKHLRASRGIVEDADGEKARICSEAQETFLQTYLAPAALAIAAKVLARSEHPFYTETARELIEFMNQEAPGVSAEGLDTLLTCDEGIRDEEANCDCH